MTYALCRIEQLHDRTDAGQVRSRTGWMKDMMNAGKVGCWNGQMQNTLDVVHIRMQDRSDAVQDGCTTGQMLDRMYAGKIQFLCVLTILSIFFLIFLVKFW